MSLILLYSSNDCIDDGVSLSSDSYRFFGFYEDEQLAEEGTSLRNVKQTRTKRNDESDHNLHEVFDVNRTKDKKKLKNGNGEDSRSYSTDEWSDVAKSCSNSSNGSGNSTGSLHNDCSRYDNVPLGLFAKFFNLQRMMNMIQVKVCDTR